MENEKTLSAEDILAADDRSELTPVKLPEWGGTVYVRIMSGAERDRFEESLIEKKGKKEVTNRSNFRAKLLVHTLCDAQGQRLFKTSDAGKLGEKNSAAISRCFDVACRVNGITEGDIEEMTGNSEAGQNGDSGSG